MKLVLVVGANGFLGSALVDKLISQECEVVAVYNSSFDKINKKAKIFTKEELFDSNIQPDTLFYLSGNYAVPHEKLLVINDDLYKYSLRFPNSKMVYISSTNVYGNSDQVITENSAFTNPGTYALSKIAGEFIVSSMKHFSILRLAYIYGPGISNNSFIPQIIHSAKENKKITLFGNGEREQDYLYIDDAVNMCLASALNKNNNIYLGATGISVSNKEIAEEIKKYTDCFIEYKGEETGKSFYFDPSKTFEELNWHPTTTIAEGIQIMLV
jgi:UDP-glucose 4-epimerase